MPTERRILNTLHQRGYKLTHQRRALIKAVYSSKAHLTPATMYQKVKKECPKIGLVTVYRTLQLLDRFGFLCKVHTDSNSNSYLLSSSPEHHHHLVCSICGSVVNFVDCGLQQLEERLTRESRYKIEDHFLEFSGRCQRCLRQKPG